MALSATFATALGNHPNYLGWGIGFFDYDNATVDEIRLRWPSGRVEQLDNIPADRLVTVEEGAGERK